MNTPEMNYMSGEDEVNQSEMSMIDMEINELLGRLLKEENDNYV